jgi:hypothetical protein
MTPDPRPTPAGSLAAASVPPRLAAWLAPFRDGFTASVWPRVLVLVAGAYTGRLRQDNRQVGRPDAPIDQPSISTKRGGGSPGTSTPKCSELGIVNLADSKTIFGNFYTETGCGMLAKFQNKG